MYDWALHADDVLYTGLDALLEYGRGFDSEKFRGCIFHVSRCGSTAIANAIRAVRHMLVISESRVLTAIMLSARYGGLNVSAETKSLLAAGFMAAVLKECAATSVVLKFPSFLSVDIAQTLSLLPTARWCFSYRRPKEVFRSLERSPSGWLGSERRREKAMVMLNFVPAATEFEAGERVGFSRMFSNVVLISARTSIDARTVCLDYADFSQTTVANILGFVLDDEYDDATLERVGQVLHIYSKSLDKRAFVPDIPLLEQPSGFQSLDMAYESYLAERNASGAVNAAFGTRTILPGSL